MISNPTAFWQLRLRTATLLALVALALEACNPVGDVQRYVRAQQLKHVDVMPPTAGGFVTAAGLTRTTAIAFLEPASNQQISVSDGATIYQVLSLLANGRASTTASGEKPATQLKLELVLDQPERVVTMIYFPDQDRVSLYNVPTPAWPEHYVGSYTVAPEFGAALLALLNQGVEP